MTAPKALTRKVGPLPVYAWAALALAAWYFLSHRTPSVSATPMPVVPSTSGTDSGAQQPASGQGSPADNMNSDLLDALLQNQQSSYEALLAALQYGQTVGGSTWGGGSSTSAVTAPTVDSGINNAPQGAVAQAGPASSPTDTTVDQYNTVSTGQPVGSPVVDPGFYTYTPPAPSISNVGTEGATSIVAPRTTRVAA